jgi:hypothetical protein
LYLLAQISYFFLFYKTSYLNEEDNRTELSSSIRVLVLPRTNPFAYFARESAKSARLTPRAFTIKLIIVIVITVVSENCAFVTNSYLHTSLIFAGKAGANPIGATLCQE